MRLLAASLLAAALPATALGQVAPAEGEVEAWLRKAPPVQISRAELDRAAPVASYAAVTTDAQIGSWRADAAHVSSSEATEPAQKARRLSGSLDATVGSSGYRDIHAAGTIPVGKRDTIQVGFSDSDSQSRKIRAGWGSLALDVLLPR